jgi:glycosyltransferase involved in cell wall biosynthesis
MNPTTPSSISVVIATYAWPEALKVALHSFIAQDTVDFELLIADDGSDAPIADLVRVFQRRNLPFHLRHIWHPREGPRPGTIANRAIEQANGQYIIMIDADCFVLPDFVSVHRRLAEEGCFVSGKRSWLRKGMTRRILASPEGQPSGRLYWFVQSLMNQCTRPFEFIALPCDRRKREGDWSQVQTCNIGFWRSDWAELNGFDERYVGMGLEDSDLAVRLIRKGIRRKLGNHASIVLHLHHDPRRGRLADSPNRELFEDLLASERFIAPVGFRQATSRAVTSTF